MTQPQFTLKIESADGNFGRFVIEPLPQGFGHTLGNALRRVLYTSVPGAAITGVTISGANHQFTSLPGVSEDVVQIILNLKQIRLSYTKDQPEHLTLSVKGPGEITAARFSLPPDVTISNPELVIAHLSDKSAHLEIEATVEAGYGYSPAEDRKSTTVGFIPTDANFTPLVRVNYEVAATRVGRVTNFDKLILDITTDGTVSPADALKSAAVTLVNYFSAIVTPATSSDTAVTASPKSAGQTGANVSIEELDLPTRIANALQKAGFETVADCLAVPKTELSKIKNLGGKSVKVIEAALAQRGFELV